MEIYANTCCRILLYGIWDAVLDMPLTYFESAELLKLERPGPGPCPFPGPGPGLDPGPGPAPGPGGLVPVPVLVLVTVPILVLVPVLVAPGPGPGPGRGSLPWAHWAQVFSCIFICVHVFLYTCECLFNIREMLLKA
jgi:hypothetical protein